MKKMKKTLCLLLALVMCLSLVNLSAFAADVTAPDLTNSDEQTIVDVTGNTDVDNTDADNTDVDNTDVDNTDVDNTDVDDTDVDNTDVDNTDVDNTDVDNADVDNTDVDNADVDNTDVDNADVDNTDVDNADVDNTDVDNADVDNTDVDNADVDNTDVDNTDADNADADNADADNADADNAESDPVEVAAEVQVFLDAVKALEALTETDEGYLEAMQDVVDAYNDLTGEQKDALEQERAEAGEEQTYAEWIKELEAKIEELSKAPEDEVPEAVQAFLDAVDELEAAINAKDAEKALAQADVCEEAFGALSEEDMEREDVVAAVARMAELLEKAATLEETDDGAVEVASYADLTAAIAAATEPTTIKLTQSFAIPNGYLQITSGKDIVLTADPDIVLGRETGGSILVRDGGKLTLRDITIDGAGDADVTAKFAFVYVYAGGVCEVASDTVMRNCHNDNSKNGGGALYNAGTLTITGGTILGNTARQGGGVYNTGTLTITDSTFSSNKASSLGGGVWSSGTLTITNGTFSDNQGGGRVGGAVYSSNKGSANKIADAKFTGNAPGAVSVAGGTLEGLSITGNNGEGPALKVDYAVTVENCEISNNKNTTSYFENGGAVFAGSNADATFKNCTIVGNTGVMCGGICVFQCNKVRLDGTVIKNNTAESSEEMAAGGIYVGDLAELTFQSGALYNNKPVDLFRVANGRTLNVLDAVDMVDPGLEDGSFFVDCNYAWQCNGEILQDSVSAILDSGAVCLIAVSQETPAVNSVYLDGTNGDDSQNGSRPAFAVKTLDRAVELAKENEVDTIYVSGAVTLTDDVDGNGVTLVRAKGYKGNLLVSRSDVTLTNLTVDGNWKNLSSANDNYNNTASLVKVTGGNLTLGEGVTLKDNQVYNYTYPQNVGGGVYVSSGKLTINGATITECVAAQGGAVGAFSGEIVMNSGTISDNDAKYWFGNSGYGGGVFVAQTARFVMNGGAISDNTASMSGGGICVGSTIGNQRKDGAYNLEVHGGTIQGNYADRAGGGIYVAAGQDSANVGYSALVDGTVSTVHIKDNTAGGHDGSFFYGGGIYVNGGKTSSDGFLKLECVVITGNTATGIDDSGRLGSGFAGCGTSETAIYFSNGGAIYGNTGDDFLADTMGLGVFSLPHVNVSPTMLGGGNYNWARTANGEAVPLDWLSGDGVFHMNAKPADTDIVAANSVARVFITGNTAAYGLGGGVGSNGRVQIGDAPVYDATEFTVTKVWNDEGFEDLRPETVTAYVERSLDKVNWETLGTVSMSGSHADSSLDWNTQVKNLLKKAWVNAEQGYSGDEYFYQVREVPVENYNSTVTGGMEDGFTITNTVKPGSLTITKALAGDGASAAANKVFTFTVTGLSYPDGTTVTVTGANSSEPLTGLIPGDYTVTEDRGAAAIEGYDLAVSGEATMTVAAGGNTTFNVTNTYTRNPGGNVETGSLTITKSVDGGGSAAAGKTYSFTITGEGGTYTASVTGAGTVTVEGITPGVYQVTEDDASISGYDLVTTGEDSVTVVAGETASITIENTYTSVPTTYPDPDPDPRPTPRPDPDPEPTDIPDPEVPTTEPDPEPTDIPDPEVPKTDVPDEQPPLVDVPDEQPPLIEWPIDPVWPWPVEVPDEQPPLVDLPEDPTPLANVPQTGDYSSVWLAALVLSVSGLAVLTLKKREGEEN